MSYQSLLQLLVLAEISDDYEEIDHIVGRVSERARRCQVFVRSDEIRAILLELVNCSFAKAYTLSTTSSPVEIAVPVEPGKLGDYYFWITERGINLLRSSRDQWPFDEEDDLVPGWSLSVDD